MVAQPNFINIGPGRCGTSWLNEVLAAHPDIGMGKIKETEFFNANYGKGTEWYESHFENVKTKRVIGEISNNYYLDAEVAERIINYDANIKIIINVRNPVNLLSSFYQFGKRRGLNLLPIQDSLNEPIGRFMGSGYDYRLKRNTLVQTDKVTLLDSVLLSDLFRPFLDTFPRNHIYLFIYEKFCQDPQGVLREIYEFLNVDPNFQPGSVTKVVNQGITPRWRLLARLGSKFAFLLRRMGAHGMLSNIHKSLLIKRLLFTTAYQNGPEAANVPKGLDTETIVLLKREQESLSQLIPELASFWELG